MKQKTIIASLIFLFSFSSQSQDILNVENSCSDDITNQIEKLDTKNPELYSYFLGYPFKDCGIDYNLVENKFNKIKSYFAKLGNSAAIYDENKDMSALLNSARNGDLTAQYNVILRNTPYMLFAKGNSSPEIIQIPREEYRRYLELTINNALKGDVRAILPALLYNLASLREEFSSIKRISITEELMDKFSKYNHMYGYIYYSWQIESYDYSLCVSNELDKNTYLNKKLEDLCKFKFKYDRELYDKLKELSPKERVQTFKDFLLSYTPLEQDVESRGDIELRLKAASFTSLFSLVDTPYSTELMPFLLFQTDMYTDEYKTSSAYWLLKSHQSNFDKRFAFALAYSQSLITGLDPNIFQSVFKMEPPYIKLLKSISPLQREANPEKTKKLLEHQLFNNGNIDALLHLIMLNSKEPIKMIALQNIYKKYRPEFANYIIQRYGPTKHLAGVDVKSYQEKIESRIPKNATTTEIHLSWNKVVKPYVIKKLDEIIAGYESTQQSQIEN